MARNFFWWVYNGTDYNSSIIKNELKNTMHEREITSRIIKTKLKIASCCCNKFCLRSCVLQFVYQNPQENNLATRSYSASDLCSLICIPKSPGKQSGNSVTLHLAVFPVVNTSYLSVTPQIIEWAVSGKCVCIERNVQHALRHLYTHLPAVVVNFFFHL